MCSSICYEKNRSFDLHLVRGAINAALGTGALGCSLWEMNQPTITAMVGVLACTVGLSTMLDRGVRVLSPSEGEHNDQPDHHARVNQIASYADLLLGVFAATAGITSMMRFVLEAEKL